MRSLDCRQALEGFPPAAAFIAPALISAADALDPPSTTCICLPITRASERWSQIGTALLGVGSFGIVRLLEDRFGRGDKRACKIVPKRRVRRMEEDIKNEVLTWSVLSGSLDVVHFYGAFEDDRNVYLLLEVCKGGELSHRMKGHVALKEAVAKRYTRTLLRLLCHMGALSIVHRDLKPDNFALLVDHADSPIKLGDFGMAIAHPPGSSPLHVRCGTPAYMAPGARARAYRALVNDVTNAGASITCVCMCSRGSAPRLLHVPSQRVLTRSRACGACASNVARRAEVWSREYDGRCDLWSAGVMIFEMLTGELPTDRELRRRGWLSSGEVLRTIHDSFSEQAKFERRCLETNAKWLSLPPGARNLVSSLLHVDPGERMPAAEALKHPWLLEEVVPTHIPFLPPSPSPSDSGHQHSGDDEEPEASLGSTLIARVQRFRTQMAVKQIVYFLMAVRIVRALADEETLRAASVSDAVSSSLSLRATSTGELAAEDIDEGVATVNDTEAPESATEDTNRSTGGETDSDYAIGESARQRASEPVALSAMLTVAESALSLEEDAASAPPTEAINASSLDERIRRSTRVCQAYQDAHRLFFRVLDADKTGVVSYAEFTKAVRGMHFSVHSDELATLLKAADVDGSGVITFVEFVTVAFTWSHVREASHGLWEILLLDIFEELDLDKSGRVSGLELRAALEKNYGKFRKSGGHGDNEFARRASLEVDLALTNALYTSERAGTGDGDDVVRRPADETRMDFEGFLVLIEPELELDTFEDRLPTRKARRAMARYVEKAEREHSAAPGGPAAGGGHGIGSFVGALFGSCFSFST